MTAVCKYKTEYPFQCWDVPSNCSYQYTVPDGHMACVRYYSDSQNDTGNPIYLIPEEGVIDHPCCPGKSWFPWRLIEECCPDGTKRQREHRMACYGVDSYLELPSGCYRFCAVDAQCNPIIPDFQDIIMTFKIKPDTGRSYALDRNVVFATTVDSRTV